MSGATHLECWGGPACGHRQLVTPGRAVYEIPVQTYRRGPTIAPGIAAAIPGERRTAVYRVVQINLRSRKRATSRLVLKWDPSAEPAGAGV